VKGTTSLRIGSELEKNTAADHLHGTRDRFRTDTRGVPSETHEQRWNDRVDMTKYFGFDARQDFYQRHKWMSEHKNLFKDDADEMDDRIRFDHQKKPSIEFPFAPRRPLQQPVMETTTGMSGNKSEISGLFSDLSFASSLPAPLESLSTFDPSLVKNESGCPTSPRSKFLNGCVKSKVNPPASLILRKKLSRSLNLPHYGFGDHYGAVYALALAEMPFIDTINIEDNNLSDKGLYPLIHAIISLATVTDLNLSNNIVDGQSAKALSDYLSSPQCCIQRLILQKADIDDDEGTAFLTALKNNTTLRELDISHNLLGKAENLNTVFPDLVTGGEALADLLSSNSCSLNTLRLPWNMIRLDGAVALSSSLQHNSHVTYLDISYNSIGEAGGEALGAALLTNHTLHTLLIQNNNLTSSACFSICVGIEENFSLREVNLDGNPIGEFGAKILTQLPIVCGERVKVSAARCNLSLKYPKDSVFNFESPSALYVLHLHDSFERAVSMKLLRLVAAHPTFEFNEVVYHPPPKTLVKARPSSAPATRQTLSKTHQKTATRATPRPQQVLLRQGATPHDPDSLDETKRMILDSLRQMQEAVRDRDQVIRLFESFDADQSGSLDSGELQLLLKSIGLVIPNDVLENAIEKFDVDGIGTLELPEFMDFLKWQEHEATERIREITELPVMIEATSGLRYIPPLQGVIHMSLGDTYTNKKSHKIISALDHQYVMELVSRGTESVAKVLIFSIQNSRLRLREALSIFHAINEEVYDKAEIAMKILPRIAEPADARLFLLQAFRYDKLLWKRLETLMGSALKVSIGLFNGFYSLDLSLEFDRVCLAKLLEQSQAKKMSRISKSLFGLGVTGDVSQWGDWSSFRNAYLDGVPTVVVPEMFNPMPTRGKIHFDFSGGSKYVYGESITNDSRCINMLTNLQLVASDQIGEVAQKLKEHRERTRRDLTGDGQFEPFVDRIKAEAIQLCMLKFYHWLPSRPLEHEQGLKMVFGAEMRAAMGASEGEGSGDGDSGGLLDDEKENEFIRQMTSTDAETYESLAIRALGPVGFSILKLNPNAARGETLRAAPVPPLATISEGKPSNKKVIGKLSSPAPSPSSGEKLNKSAKQRPPDSSLESPQPQSQSQREKEREGGGKKVNPLLTQRKASPKTREEAVVKEENSPRTRPRLPASRIGFFQEAEEERSAPESMKHNLAKAPLVTNRRGPQEPPSPAATLPSVTSQSGGEGDKPPSSSSNSLSRTRSTQSFVSTSPSPALPVRIFAKAQSAANLLQIQPPPLTPTAELSQVAPTTESRPSQLRKLESLVSFDDDASTSSDQESGRGRVGGEPRAVGGGGAGVNPRVLLPQNTEEYMQGYGVGVTSLSSQAAKAMKIVDALCDVLSRVWILSRHLALICEYFLSGLAIRTLHFGTFRVELIVLLYSRLADVHNFDLVLKVLTPHETACVICRLGLLNLFNPLKPEGTVCLNLSRREERVVAKVLAVLSVYEPGDNWLEKSFRWGYDKEEIPGWELTKLWLTEEGMLQKGFLVVTYYSGEGQHRRGCCPNVPFRKSLLHLVCSPHPPPHHPYPFPHHPSCIYRCLWRRQTSFTT
jgi:Ran GTPase-activating protein (RanGAP) involved in mRNA processing and transport